MGSGILVVSSAQGGRGDKEPGSRTEDRKSVRSLSGGLSVPRCQSGIRPCSDPKSGNPVALGH